MNMGKQGEGIFIDDDKKEFDEIMAYLNEKQNEFNEAIKTSTIREHIDPNLVNDILLLL